MQPDARRLDLDEVAIKEQVLDLQRRREQKARRLQRLILKAKTDALKQVG